MKEKKSKLLNMRLTPNEMEFLRRRAKAKRMTIKNFVLSGFASELLINK
jgi:uncharacterized protein (DUF1778 family)